MPGDNSGRKPRLTDDELLAVICNLLNETDAPIVTTQEIEEQVPLKRRGLSMRLSRLRENGRLSAKQVGARSYVWWLDEDAGGNDVDAQGVEDEHEEAEDREVQGKGTRRFNFVS